MIDDSKNDTPDPGQVGWQRAVRDHSRSWRQNHYVYPVLSRRARGISIGININPDQVCNFRCVYCQVNRTGLAAGRGVDLDVLARELDEMLEQVATGRLFREPIFADAPAAMRRVSDIAFSGDGEPTLSKAFPEAARIVASARQTHALPADMNIVVLTNAGFLDRPSVQEALDLLHVRGGVLWAKLDAGTESHFLRMNRCAVPLRKTLENIALASRRWRVVIQSMWLRFQDHDPDPAEVDALADRLSEIIEAGGMLQAVHVYTVARPPAENYVSGVTEPVLRAVGETIARRTHLPVEIFPGPS
jgi:wyosine [tRNA(Phe)-imidazoG37] synthetase (radical SAM superfamily)